MNNVLNMPRSATKKELFQFFDPISKQEVRREAWQIISKKRNITVEKAKNVKRLRKNEVELLMQELGVLG